MQRDLADVWRLVQNGCFGRLRSRSPVQLTLTHVWIGSARDALRPNSSRSTRQRIMHPDCLGHAIANCSALARAHPVHGSVLQCFRAAHRARHRRKMGSGEAHTNPALGEGVRILTIRRGAGESRRHRRAAPACPAAGPLARYLPGSAAARDVPAILGS